MTSVDVARTAVAYRDQTMTSRRVHEEAEKSIPGGVSRQTLAFPPYPFYAATAAGSIITDVDGNDYVDLVNNYTSLIHGHAFAPVTDAITEVANLVAVGAPHVLEAKLAELLTQRLPALDWLHFTTTGSEAVTYALRTARAATRRDRILTFEGGFHGSSNEMVRDVASPPLPPGSAVPARAASAGLEPTTAITAVYNDLASVDNAFAMWGREIAAVIIEPFLGNTALIPASNDFIEQVFTVAHRHGALVIFDEVQALRLGYHGTHGLDGWTPDLVAIGKIMGGGFPVAAFGGRRDLSSVLEGRSPALVQTGTFTGTPISLAAGLAAMTHLTESDFDQLDELGQRLRDGLREEFYRAGVDAQVNGRGSMFNVSITTETVTSYRAAKTAEVDILTALHAELLARGVLMMPRGTGCLSTAHSGDDITQVVEAFRVSLAAVSTR